MSSPLFTNLLKKPRLRTLLIVPFMLQIFAAVGLVGFFSFRNGQKAVNDLATQLRNEITARIEQQLQTYVDIPHRINALNTSALARGDLSAINVKGQYLLWQQARIFEATNLIYCGSERDGSLLGVGRAIDDRTLQLVVYNESTNYRGYYYRLDVTGDRTFLLRQGSQRYNARIRPWYQAAKTNEGASWSDIYLDFDTELPTITASLPVYDETGNQILGVCATDFLLPVEVSAFLSQLEVGKSGETFIVERSGALVASSTAEAIVAGDGETPERLDATASRNPLVRGTADYLNERFGSLSAIERSQQLEFTLEGERQFVQVLPFNDNRGLDWLIVLVVPETDFMAQIHANNRTTILLCLLALGVATAVGIAFSRWITQPILHLNQASQAIAAGDLKQNVRVKGIRELEALAASFNSMAHQLKTSFQALEAKNADLQQAKDALAQAKEHLEAVLNAVPGSISWIGAGGIYLGVNRYLADSLSLLPEDIIGKEIGFFNNSPEYAQFLHQFLASSEEAASQIISVTVKNELRYYLIAAQKYQKNSAAVSVGIDITERRQAQEALRIAEENYRSIYENALEGIFQSTPDGRYMSVNPAMARIHGFNSPEEMVASITNIGKQIYADWQRREEFKRLMGEYGEVKGFEYQAYHSNGTLIWLEENTRAVLDGCGNLLYYEGIIQEITDRKCQEAALKRQLEELKIEIDHKKRAQEVTKITQADYFKELQAEVDTLNVDEFWDFDEA